MAHLNKCSFIGNIGADPEIRQTNDGKDIANISIGVTENWKDKNSGERQSKTEWVRVTLFGGAATFTKNYIKKGNLVFIEGSLRTRKYTDKNGIEKYSTEIVVQNMNGQIQNLSPKDKDDSKKEDPAWQEIEKSFDDDIPF